MSFNTSELSVDNGNPVEIYIFTYNGVEYAYTSSNFSQAINLDGVIYTCTAEYIHRGDSLKLGATNKETCIVTMNRTSQIGLLYQGAPPEEDGVELKVYRMHGEGQQDYIKILDGTVTQAHFTDSEVELTITIENVMSRNVPKGKLSYYCINCIYDNKCTLNMDEWKLKCYVDSHSGLTIHSKNLEDVENGWFTDGFIKMGNCYRQIKRHEGNTIYLKYPINDNDKQNTFYAYAGCSNLFTKCARKFHNTDNFSGVPYIPAYNVYTRRSTQNPPAYWVMTDVITRDTDGKIYSMNLG